MRRLTTDASGLFAMRQRLAKPTDNMILPDIISKEPLGPAVRQDDMQWFNIVKWVNFAMLNAEELGVSSKTIDDALKSQKPSVKRLVGTEGDFGKPFGLSAGLGRARGPRGRQLRRSVRPQRRRAFEARNSAGLERIVEQRRHSIRPADPVAPRDCDDGSAAFSDGLIWHEGLALIMRPPGFAGGGVSAVGFGLSGGGLGAGLGAA